MRQFGLAAVAALLGVLASCGVERPVFQPRIDRLADLKAIEPPPAPAIATADTEDEAEIQFRAGLVFYRTSRWRYATAAFAEALDYDEDRHDIRYFLAASLMLATREVEAVEQVEELLDTKADTEARVLLAPLYLRAGRLAEAREAILPAAELDYVAAGWLARFDVLCPLPPAPKPAEGEERKLRTLQVRYSQ